MSGRLIQYIKLTDVNVNGGGEDVVVIVKIQCILPLEGVAIKKESILRVEEAIESYKAENPGEWDTEGCVNAAFAQLEKEGFKAEVVDFAAEIEF